VFDAGRRAFPIFAKANGVGEVQWTTMDPPLRETMLARGDLDAITGFTFTSLLNLEPAASSAKTSWCCPMPPRREALRQRHHRQPQADRRKARGRARLPAALPRAPRKSSPTPKPPSPREGPDGIVNTALEVKRLKLAIDTAIDSKGARAEGFGQLRKERLALMAEQVSDAYATKTRCPPTRCGTAASCPLPPNWTCFPSAKPDAGQPCMRRPAPTFEVIPMTASSQDPAFVDFRDVWLAYNDELLAQNHFAVEAIDLQVRRGEFIAIVGPRAAASPPS
jgi:NitT/TauT family transport system substrate-binding protein